MPDSTHYDAAEDGFHEIQLSGKQLVFLFMATTIVAVVIFLCGVQVGRGVRNDRGAEATDVAATTPAPAASTSTAAAAPAASGPPAAEPPAPPKESDEDLSYAKRLQSDATPTERLKPERAAASAPPPPQPIAKAAKPVEQPQAPTPAGRPGTWVVQVHALKDRNAAAAIARGLASKGYPAFVLDPAPGSPAIYRVQVGRYNDRHEAEQVAVRLKKQEQFNPWVQR